MYNEHETQFDLALTEFMTGATLESLILKYPEVADELRTAASVMSVVGDTKHMAPKKEGLQALLDSIPVSHQYTQKPSPYLAFFTLYRNAFVFPVLLLVLVGAGVLIYPSNTKAPTSTDTQPTLTPQAKEPPSSVPNTPAPKNSGTTGASSAPKADAPMRMMLMSAPTQDSGTTTATTTASTTPETKP